MCCGKCDVGGEKVVTTMRSLNIMRTKGTEGGNNFLCDRIITARNVFYELSGFGGNVGRRLKKNKNLVTGYTTRRLSPSQEFILFVFC